MVKADQPAAVERCVLRRIARMDDGAAFFIRGDSQPYCEGRAIMILFLLIMLFGDEETGITTGIIRCGMYGYIVWNNFRTIRLQSQD